MTIVAVLLVIAAFIGGWWYTAHTLKDMESLLPHLLGIAIGFVAMFCLTGIFFFFGILSL